MALMESNINYFKKYYSSEKFVTELLLPEKPNLHHYRFQLFSKGIFRRLYDVVRTKENLIKIINEITPKNIYFTPIKWLDPVNVRRSKFYDDYMLSSPLYFDIDGKDMSDNNLKNVIENTEKLIDLINNEYNKYPDWIIFSGRQGFHLYYWIWDNIPQHVSSSEERISTFRRSRKDIISFVNKNNIIIDKKVTADPWRILRLPGTLHGQTGYIAKKIDNLSSFSLEQVTFFNAT